MGKRLDAQDTVDVAVHFLHRLQAEGWGVKSVEHEVEYGSLGKHRLPVAAYVTVRLIPANRG